MKKESHSSLLISIVFSFLGIPGVLVLAVLLPFYIEWKCTNTVSFITEALPSLPEKIFIYFIGYLLLLAALVADILLFLLLCDIRQKEVFTTRTVQKLKLISLFVLLLGLLFALLTPWFKMAFVVGFLIVFMGLVIKVIKNVIEEAVKIKQENDFTI